MLMFTNLFQWIMQTFFYVKKCCFVMYDPDIKISFWKQLHLRKKHSLFDFLKNRNSLINKMQCNISEIWKYSQDRMPVIHGVPENFNPVRLLTIFLIVLILSWNHFDHISNPPKTTILLFSTSQVNPILVKWLMSPQSLFLFVSLFCLFVFNVTSQ